MSPFAQSLSDADMADLAAYYQSQTARRRPATVDPAKVAEGQRLAGVHHCTSCHRPTLAGQEQAARLAGQDFTTCSVCCAASRPRRPPTSTAP